MTNKKLINAELEVINLGMKILDIQLCAVILQNESASETEIHLAREKELESVVIKQQEEIY